MHNKNDIVLRESKYIIINDKPINDNDSPYPTEIKYKNE